MRAPAILAAATLLVLPLAALAPTASAFTWCVGARVPGHSCSSHLVCIGWGGPSPETCQYGIPSDPCDLWTCGPGPVLP